jgi:hypothetical protein
MLTRVRSFFRAMIQGRRVRRELDEEMAFHIDQLAQDLMRQGMHPDEPGSYDDYESEEDERSLASDTRERIRSTALRD